MATVEQPMSPAETTAHGGERTLLPGQSPQGEYILSVLVKRTFDLAGGACARAAEDEPLNAGEVFWDHPMNSSVRYESDFVPYKVGTDVILNGTAYAPGGSPAESCTVALQVNQRRKVLSVIGDRQASHTGGAPAFTNPVPFTTMPLRYERAYGGIDVYSDLRVPYPFPRNPLGRGFVVANTAAALAKLSLPNVEDPGALVTPDTLCLGEYSQWETRPYPAGFGWYQKTWLPRASLAGVMPRDRAVEQELRRAYAELVPADQREAYVTNGFRDMDFRFFNGASPGLAFPYLKGGESIVTENLTPSGRFDFRLPTDSPRIGIDIGEGFQEPAVVLHTVMIRLDEGQVDLVWRGSIPYRGPDWLPEMTKLDLQVV